MVVPGKGGTLGKTLCLALAREGAHVVILARNPSKLSSFKERFHGLDGSAEVLEADVLDKENCLPRGNHSGEVRWDLRPS
ncbi:MAG: SDR family NAD(P)-dependent oxidoreductase [Thermodesulfobacteriota bacterium]